MTSKENKSIVFKSDRCIGCYRASCLAWIRTTSMSRGMIYRGESSRAFPEDWWASTVATPVSRLPACIAKMRCA